MASSVYRPCGVIDCSFRVDVGRCIVPIGLCPTTVPYVVRTRAGRRMVRAT
jgi:hypothetical protein